MSTHLSDPQTGFQPNQELSGSETGLLSLLGYSLKEKETKEKK